MTRLTVGAALRRLLEPLQHLQDLCGIDHQFLATRFTSFALPLTL